MDDPREVIAAYGAVLEEVSTGPEYHAVHPESKLPYPKAVIQRALEWAIPSVTDQRLKEQLKMGLICLDDFVPDDQVATDPHEQVTRLANDLLRPSKN